MCLYKWQYDNCFSGPESFTSPVCPSAEDHNFTIQSPDELKSLYLVSTLHLNLSIVWLFPRLLLYCMSLCLSKLCIANGGEERNNWITQHDNDVEHIGTLVPI